MGSLCSKLSNYDDGPTIQISKPANKHTLGPPAVAPLNSARPDPRTAAAEAAERRLKTAQTVGTNESNPKRGKLAEQLAKRNRGGTEPQLPERIIWD